MSGGKWGVGALFDNVPYSLKTTSYIAIAKVL